MSNDPGKGSQTPEEIRRARERLHPFGTDVVPVTLSDRMGDERRRIRTISGALRPPTENSEPTIIAGVRLPPGTVVTLQSSATGNERSNQGENEASLSGSTSLESNEDATPSTSKSKNIFPGHFGHSVVTSTPRNSASGLSTQLFDQNNLVTPENNWDPRQAASDGKIPVLKLRRSKTMNLSTIEETKVTCIPKRKLDKNMATPESSSEPRKNKDDTNSPVPKLKRLTPPSTEEPHITATPKRKINRSLTDRSLSCPNQRQASEETSSSDESPKRSAPRELIACAISNIETVEASSSSVSGTSVVQSDMSSGNRTEDSSSLNEDISVLPVNFDNMNLKMADAPDRPSETESQAIQSPELQNVETSTKTSPENSVKRNTEEQVPVVNQCKKTSDSVAQSGNASTSRADGIGAEANEKAANINDANNCKGVAAASNEQNRTLLRLDVFAVVGVSSSSSSEQISEMSEMSEMSEISETTEPAETNSETNSDKSE
ncbi:uncharacterized protein LOC106660127 [Trichogramma pretiosum]|uniref:uncharacterized protein LOC106660127 n=1 Tax=Trichogramma pretiosum TaxID=7493 RepID=UPI0006C9A48B|nr:uncharacterized protein LOC106660127 [Trichogramma pretiosum]